MPGKAERQRKVVPVGGNIRTEEGKSTEEDRNLEKSQGSYRNRDESSLLKNAWKCSI